MTRKGRLLELMVKSLEELLSSKGINVQSPEEFRDEKGVKIGEIDVTLRGEFGSATISVGLECRERPQDGAQGSDWIREIKGKKDQFKLEKMIAVSSTGFTDQAIKTAQELGIELRTLEVANLIDLNTWFDTLEMTISTGSYVDKNFELAGIIGLQTDEEITNTIEVDGSISFIKNAQGQLVPLHEYIKSTMDLLFAILQANSQILEMKTELEYGPIDIVLDDTEYKIKKMSVPIRLWQEVIKAFFLLSAYKDPKREGIIALSGVCEVKLSQHPLRKVVLSANKKIDEYGEFIDLNCSFLNQNNEPSPVNGAMALYGWNGINQTE